MLSDIRTDTMMNIAIPIEEYKELLQIKGKVEVMERVLDKLLQQNINEY